jgi:long-chain acyl-CoA synthetase
MEAGGDQLNAQWILLSGSADGILTLDDLRRAGRGRALDVTVNPQDYAILYLTSGATGEPKMGLATHHALVSNINMGPKVVDIGPHDVILAFLPSAHIAQRIGIELLAMRMGVPSWFSEGLSKMPHELQRVRPTFFLAPPRVWERVFASVSTEIRKRGGLTKRIFWAALGLGLRASRLRQKGRPLPPLLKTSLKLADRIVFRKLRERFGGRMRLPVSGAAPLGKDLASFYDAIGMPLVEGYGLTEGGIVALNPMVNPKAGSIGKLLPGVLYRIAEEGELALAGPTIFSGYYKDPETTAQVLRDGWLYTGDIAERDEDGFFYITGRKKEMIVSSNGKKIYPSRIENLFKTEPIINQMILVGDRKPWVGALFTINTANAETLKGMDEYRGRSTSEIALAPPVRVELKKAIKRANKQLAPFEQIRKFRILDTDFSIERGELTATMKVRRAKVLENYKTVVNHLYSGKEEYD